MRPALRQDEHQPRPGAAPISWVSSVPQEHPRRMREGRLRPRSPQTEVGAAVWLCDVTNADPGFARPSPHGLLQTRCPGLGLDLDSGLQMREAGTAAASGPQPSGSWARPGPGRAAALSDRPLSSLSQGTAWILAWPVCWGDGHRAPNSPSWSRFSGRAPAPSGPLGQ